MASPEQELLSLLYQRPLSELRSQQQWSVPLKLSTQQFLRRLHMQ